MGQPRRLRRRSRRHSRLGCKHSTQCFLCKKIIEFVICRRKDCVSGKHYAMWETIPSKWKKVPKKYQKKVLCIKCFKRVSGISPGPQYWGD